MRATPFVLINEETSDSLKDSCSPDKMLTVYDVLDAYKRDPKTDFVFSGFGPDFEQIEDDDSIYLSTIGMSTLNSLLGEPLHRGEVLSIEGYGNTGKTRMCVKILHDAIKEQNCKVLYIDSDMNLSQRILERTLLSMDCQLDGNIPIIRDPRVRSESEDGSLTIVACIDENMAFDAIQEYLSHTIPDLIIIDSLFSMFQNVMGKDAPGPSQLEELAIELKSVAFRTNCAVIVTNCLKQPNGTPVSFLGPQYNQMWHSRIILSTKDHFTATAKLVCSPRIREKVTNFYLQSLKYCSEKNEIDNSSTTSDFE